MVQRKLRVAFVKFGGLSAGGTERWMQMMAANLPRDEFEIDYYYCDAAPYVGSSYQHAQTDPERLRYMETHGLNLIRFHVGAKDVTVPTHDWLDTDFWEVFDARKYDFVQAGKAGHAEYPFHLIGLPFIEFVSLSAGVDRSHNLRWTVHLSQYQRRSWVRKGGRLNRSSVIPIPVEPPASLESLRSELGIPDGALVAGFHQRADNEIASPWPLQAFAKMRHPGRHFVIMGGGARYREQAHELGLENIHFVDHCASAHAISRFLNTLDIYAHGRRDGETFGTVLAEAMMHGKPCLSHVSLVGNNNAQPETMGPAGLFARDLGEYTAMLESLFSEHSLRSRLAEKARPHAEAYYSLPAAVESLTRLYRDLHGRPNPTREGRPLAYGISPLGYLQAGDLENPASLASTVVTGEVGEPFEIHMAKLFLPTVQTFIDIGANAGLYCLVAAHMCPRGARIHAFEPQPDCVRALQQTISLNNWQERLIVHQLGLGKNRGEFTLHLSGTGSSFDNAFNDYAPLDTIRVPVDTLDSQVAGLNTPNVDFIKIDVEGLELDVLTGGASVIERDHPVLFIEIADRVRGRSYRNPAYDETLAWLMAQGYQVWRCTESGRLQLAIHRQPQQHLAMYLCLHIDKHSAWIEQIHPWAHAFHARKLQDRYFHWKEKALKAMHNPSLAARVLAARLRGLMGLS